MSTESSPRSRLGAGERRARKGATPHQQESILLSRPVAWQGVLGNFVLPHAVFVPEVQYKPWLRRPCRTAASLLIFRTVDMRVAYVQRFLPCSAGGSRPGFRLAVETDVHRYGGRGSCLAYRICFVAFRSDVSGEGRGGAAQIAVKVQSVLRGSAASLVVWPAEPEPGT